MSKSKDIVWIDWVKSICVFFVYWCHVIQLGSNVSPINIPYGFFFVNGFFFVSGYLIFSKQMSETEIVRNVKDFWKINTAERGMLSNVIFKLAIPSVIFSTLDYVPKAVIRGQLISGWGYFKDTFIRGTNWFTCALTVSEIIIFFLLLSRLNKIRYYLLLGVVIAIVGKYLQDSQLLILGDYYLPWFYKSGMIATVFLVLGGLFFKYENRVDNLLVGGGYYLLPLIIYIFLVIFTPLGKEPASVQDNISFLGLLMSLLSIISLIYICKTFKYVRIIKFVSRHSIGFYFLSASIPFVCTKLVEHFLPLCSCAFFICLGLSFATSMMSVYLLNRFFPFLFDLRKIILKYR